LVVKLVIVTAAAMPARTQPVVPTTQVEREQQRAAQT
jgi:hypothetical protein